MSAFNKWYTRRIDFVPTFHQAPVERKIHMDTPRRFQIKGGNTKDYVLKLRKNIYGLNQAVQLWYTYLTNILVNKVDFKQSKMEKCIFYCGNVMCVLYNDDSILAGTDPKDIDNAINDIKADKINTTDEGDIQDFLGVNIEYKPDSKIHLT